MKPLKEPIASKRAKIIELIKSFNGYAMQPKIYRGKCIQYEVELGRQLTWVEAEHYFKDLGPKLCTSHGLLLRLQAPGYLDSTPWTFHTSWASLIEELQWLADEQMEANV